MLSPVPPESPALRVKITLARETLEVYKRVARSMGMPTSRLLARILVEAMPAITALDKALGLAGSAVDEAQRVLFEGFVSVANDANRALADVGEALGQPIPVNRPPLVEAARSRGDSAARRKRPARSPSTSAAPRRRRKTPGL